MKKASYAVVYKGQKHNSKILQKKKKIEKTDEAVLPSIQTIQNFFLFFACMIGLEIYKKNNSWH